MSKEAKVFSIIDYIELLEDYRSECWEEADYATECSPIKFKCSDHEERRRDEYIDFSDSALG